MGPAGRLGLPRARTIARGNPKRPAGPISQLGAPTWRTDPAARAHEATTPYKNNGRRQINTGHRWE
eukprot:3013570-Lingulodinium_polyedra.AAC.1